MEERAIETLKLMLGRRDPNRSLEVKEVVIDNVTQNSTTPANAYTIGDVLVVFSRRAKFLENEIRSMMTHIEATEFNKSRLIVVSLSKSSENVAKVIKSYAKDGIQFFHIQELQYDLMSHRLYVPHRILNEDERTAILNQYKISNAEDQIPWIDSQDPPVRWIGGKPGDILEVTRFSDAAGPSLYYRYVIEDAYATQ